MESDVLEPIAIVGFALKFPRDADTSTSFWEMMEGKRCAMTAWPKDRINLDAFYHNDNHQEGNSYVPGAHFLADDLGAFDASFFGISATEAVAIDPQHRFLLETAYHALENAGIPMESVYGSKTGVYSGSMTDDYKSLITKDVDDMPKYTATGVSMNMVANRLSWFFNFTGPSVNMDSACSSSLMALDMACQGLRSRDAAMALVAGGSMILAVEGVLSLMNMNFLSPNGRCYSFDERANGYSRGEGFGVVLIKRLSDAIRDGNPIRAVIRATGSNQDGHTPGVTQPSRDAQARLIRETYSKANLGYESTRFFEAHGAKISSPQRGALKGNIGHLEGGSGVAGLIKTVMVLEKGVIPPNANFEQVNPSIDADFMNIKFPIRSTAWPTIGLRRASVSSFGFGGSNSHAILDDAYHFLASRSLNGRHHTITAPPTSEFYSRPQSEGSITPTFRSAIEHYEISDCPIPANRLGSISLDTANTRNSQRNGINGVQHVNGASRRQMKPRVYVWSTGDEGGAKRLVELWEKYFSELLLCPPSDEDKYLRDLAYTLSAHRSSLPWKSFTIADSLASLAAVRHRLSTPKQHSKILGIGFIFTGQGAQYKGMGADLMTFPVFRQTLDAFDRELFLLGCEWSIFDEITEHGSSSCIDDPQFSQPLTTALQIALYELLRDFNLTPSSVVGHSSGEIAAAYAAGGLSLQSACRVSYYRGQLSSALIRSANAPGAMLSVDLSEHEIRTSISKITKGRPDISLHVACINSSRNVTVSGNERDIDMLRSNLETKGLPAQKLKTGVAYHSPAMRHISVEYEQVLRDLHRPREDQPRRVQMISSVTGELIRDMSILTEASYWVNNMVQPVRFHDAISQLVSRSQTTRRLGSKAENLVHDIVEVGPHPALRRPIKLAVENANVKINYAYALSRQKHGIDGVLELAGLLLSSGYPIAMDKVNQIHVSKATDLSVLANLPQYPFDHSRSYWFESEISRHSRVRKFPRLELLGTPVPDWNALEPRWRKFFDFTETPWIEDHKVNGKPIYPATGMVVMAIESAKQIADPERAIVGYSIKDATFSRPIGIDEIRRTEVQLFMRPTKSSANRNFTPSEYRIYVREGSEWQETCRGLIQVHYETSKNELDTDYKLAQRSRYYQDKFEEARIACSQHVETEQMYEQFKKNGLNYGPAFRALDCLAWDGSSGSMGILRPFQWTSQQSKHKRQEHVVHPVTLDAAGQLMWVALTKGATETVVNGAAVTRIRDAWISSSGLTYPETMALRAYSTSAPKGLRGTDSSMFALDDSGNLKLAISHMETTSVSGNGASSESEPRQICYGLDWKPDLSCLTATEIVSYCKSAVLETPDPVGFYQDLTLVLLYFVRSTLQHIHDNDVTPSQPHMQNHLAWLKMQAGRYEVGESPAGGNDWISRIQDENAMRILIEQVASSGPEGKLFATVGRQLTLMIKGIINPLEVMFGDGLAASHYQDICDKIPSCRQLWNYLDAYAHQNPEMKIIEVGAGTGSITGHILAPLLHKGNGQNEPRLSQYDYTDISESFFEKARDKFGKAKAVMNFGIFNIEDDPKSQGYEAGTYDVVVAAWVLHATPSLAATVQNVRKLLKPGGKLVLLEITRPDILRNGFAFGTLPGWWLGTEKYRQWSPCITEHQWQAILLENGFSAVDFALPDYEDERCQEMSIMVATATEDKIQVAQCGTTYVVVDEESTLQMTVAKGFYDSVSSSARAPQQTCEILPLHKLQQHHSFQDNIILFLLELEKPVLYDLDEATFRSLQELAKSSKSILWATAANIKSSLHPRLGMIQGFARVLCTEDNSLSFVTIALENHEESPHIWVNHITKVFFSTTTKEEVYSELEYIERDGTLMIGRVHEENQLNHELHARTSTTFNNQGFCEGPPLTLAIGNPGSLDSLHFVEDTRYYMDLQPDDVEIEVKAVGVNFRDLLVVLGKYNADTVGCECSGIVTRVGANCTTVRPGDRVCAAIVGCIYTYARCNFQLAVRIPDDMPFAQAASLPITGVTAHHSLVTVARLRKEDSILIHSGAGGTGQMAIQIAQSIGCEIFVTVGSHEKHRLLTEIYCIPDDHILYSRDTTFTRDIMRLTQGKGVDVVLNSLSGESLIASWEVVAPFGRFVELGKADIEANAKLSMVHFANNVSFSAIAIDHITSTRPLVVRESLLHILEKVAEGSIKIASPLHEFQISDIEEAFRFMQSGRNTGKTVLNIASADAVPALLRHKPSYSFEEDATYLVAGGLGGLGRSAARWMAQRGAKNLILLSRSGPKTRAAQKLLEELRGQGVRTETPACDVSSTETLSATLEKYTTMPPIKGCLQATMVLQDAIFSNMSYSSWTTSIKSKVHSTWNLHSLLPHDLTFFIMLSSVAGIAGSPSQSNYAAGNTFQDALAHHRRSLGLAATSIDLGVMGEVGIVAENEAYAQNKEAAADLATIKEQEFLALLDYYCDPNLEAKKSWQVQPIIGLVTPGQFRAKGMEPPDWIERPMFKTLPRSIVRGSNNASNEATAGATRDYAAELSKADTDSERDAIMMAALLQKLSKALSVGEDNIDVGKPLHAYGVDSLLAVELRNWFGKVFKVDVAVFDITGQRSVEVLVRQTVEKMGLGKKD
ncbi:MAG: hypothetical protein Q9213_002766 [Squamulea squamosa]